MDNKVKELWVNALRSGEYTQGDQYLKSKDSFCCLGVLCDLHRKHQEGNDWIPSSDTPKSFLYVTSTGEREIGELPNPVLEWAGLDNPMVPVDYDGALTPIYILNDGDNDYGIESLTFTELANIIEDKL